jgi:hypothetical protein
MAYSFVNDTDLIQPTARTLQESKQDVALELQRALNTREGAIRATGGNIVPPKSFWYLIGFKWHEGNWSYKDDTDAPATLSVRDSNGNIFGIGTAPTR